MAVADEVKEKAVPGVLIAIGVAVLLPVIRPFLASVARPFAKGAVKGGLVVFEKGKEKLAEAGEVFEDLLAEARAELAEEQKGATGGGASQATEQGKGPGSFEQEVERGGEEMAEDIAADVAKEAVQEVEKDIESEVAG